MPGCGQCPGERLSCRVLGSGGGAKRDAQVTGRAGERADRRKVGHLARRRGRTGGLEAGERDDPDAGLQPVHATEARWDPDRAHQIRAVLQIGHPGGHGRRRTAGGTAGCAREIPGIARDAVQLVAGLREVPQHERHIGLSDDDRAGLSQSCDHRGVPVGDELLKRRIAPGGVQPGDVERLLDRHRHAVQQPGPLAARDGLVGGRRLPQRGLAAQLHDRVQLRIDSIDPAQHQLGQLAGTDLPPADHPRRSPSRLHECLFHHSRHAQLTPPRRSRATGPMPSAIRRLLSCAGGSGVPARPGDQSMLTRRVGGGMIVPLGSAEVTKLIVHRYTLRLPGSI